MALSLTKYRKLFDELIEKRREVKNQKRELRRKKSDVIQKMEEDLTDGNVVEEVKQLIENENYEEAESEISELKKEYEVK